MSNRLSVASVAMAGSLVAGSLPIQPAARAETPVAPAAAVSPAAVRDPLQARVGAIRWDAWHGDHGTPGRAVEQALGPVTYHGRLPFFAQVLGDDAVRIDGTPQAVMDAEITYAADAGLAYWAFVTYPPGEAMSIGLSRYLSSSKRSRIDFCLLTEAGRWAHPEFVTRLAALMTEPGYLRTADGRPVLFLGFIEEAKVVQNWGSRAGFRAVVDACRADAVARGAGNPYIVIMDFNPVDGKSWLDALGADAISSYATSAGGNHSTYAELAKHTEGFWQRCVATGAQVVPLGMSGWDRRPRIARPMPWETWQKPGNGSERYYLPPTPGELAAHVSRLLDWMAAHPDATREHLAIIYAWNENDEGGWLVPTLGEGNARLDALRPLLLPR